MPTDRDRKDETPGAPAIPSAPPARSAPDARAELLASTASRRARKRARAGTGPHLLEEPPPLDPLDARQPPPPLPPPHLEEPEWARAALELAVEAVEPVGPGRVGRVPPMPATGPLLWTLGPDDVAADVLGDEALGPPFLGEPGSPSGASGLRRYLLPRNPETLSLVAPTSRARGPLTASRNAALVTMWEQAGRRTLLDLARVTSLAIDAPPIATATAFSDLIVELADHRWSDLDELILVSLGREMEGLCEVRFADSVATAEQMILPGLAEARSAGAPRSRCIALSPGRPEPYDPSSLARLVDLVEQIPGACLLCCEPTAPVRSVLHLQARREPLRLDFRRRGAVVASVLPPTPPPVRHAVARVQSPAGLADEVEEPGGSGSDQAGTGAARPRRRAERRRTQDPEAPPGARVALLGPVEVTGPGVEVTGKPMATELVLYLALHPEGVTGDVLSAAIWPERRVSSQSLSNRLSETRHALGPARDGSSRLGRRGSRHVLSSDVGCDWAEFQDLVGPGSDPDDWRRALDLVRGRPLEGLIGCEWTVGEGFAALLEATIVDTALRLAEASLDTGDLLTAEWSVRRGIVVAPWDERLYRFLMRVADAGGNRRGIEGALQALAVALDIPGDPLEAVHPATAALYRRLMGQYATGSEHLGRSNGRPAG